MGRAASLRAILPTVAIAIAIGGCGSGGGDATTGGGQGKALSPSQFREEAAKGCLEARNGYREKVHHFLVVEGREKPRRVVYSNVTRLLLLPTIDAEMGAVLNLGLLPRALELLEEALDEGEDVLNRIVYERRIPSIGAVYRQFAKVTRTFRAAGLPECMNGSSVTGLGL